MRTNFRMEDKNITMIKGDTLSFGIEFYDENMKPLEDDLDKIYFTVKNSTSNIYQSFQKSLGKGIVKQETGKYSVRVAPEDTKHLNSGKYFYDLEVQKNGDVFTLLKGILEIEEDVTNDELTEIYYTEITKEEIDGLFEEV